MSSEEVDESENSTAPRWRRSESPPDPWDLNDDQKGVDDWAFEIIGEEVDYDGNVLHERRQVRWNDWNRADGTKTTWESVDSPDIDSSAYRKKQSQRRRTLAKESFAVDVPSTADVHNTETFLRNQAYNEKLLLSEKEQQPDWIAEMAVLISKHQEDIRPGHGASSLSSQPSVANPVRSRRESTRQLTETSLASSSTAVGRGASRAMSAGSSATATTTANKPPNRSTLSQTSSFDPLKISFHEPKPTHQEMPQVPPSAKSKGKQRAQDFESTPPPTDYSPSPRKRVKRMVRSASSDELSIVPSSSSFIVEASQLTRLRLDLALAETPETKRWKLAREWTATAQKERAAGIFIINTVDDEAIPPLEKTFVYLEREYRYARGITVPDSGFVTSCDCVQCGPHPANCGCQDDSDAEEFAYTPSGLFRFNVPKNKEVIECNANCACSVKTCINSVSRRPRDVPVEVFKTKGRGWGVRAHAAVNRGKVLGIYTGLVITREVSHALQGDLGAYSFDLDGDEMVDDSQLSQSMPGGKYSVDSRTQGNWTRFINHSCSPNLEIYLVVHDKPAGCGMPYIVFVANQHISAHTEFTFDYHPEAAVKILADRKKKNNKKSKTPIPEGAVECLCGARNCRGILN